MGTFQFPVTLLRRWVNTDLRRRPDLDLSYFRNAIRADIAKCRDMIARGDVGNGAILSPELRLEKPEIVEKRLSDAMKEREYERVVEAGPWG